jgi:hypothetical protein
VRIAKLTVPSCDALQSRTMSELRAFYRIRLLTSTRLLRVPGGMGVGAGRVWATSNPTMQHLWGQARTRARENPVGLSDFQTEGGNFSNSLSSLRDHPAAAPRSWGVCFGGSLLDDVNGRDCPEAADHGCAILLRAHVGHGPAPPRLLGLGKPRARRVVGARGRMDTYSVVTISRVHWSVRSSRSVRPELEGLTGRAALAAGDGAKWPSLIIASLTIGICRGVHRPISQHRGYQIFAASKSVLNAALGRSLLRPVVLSTVQPTGRI